MKDPTHWSEVGLQAFFIAPGNAVLNLEELYTIDLCATGLALRPSAHVP